MFNKNAYAVNQRSKRLDRSLKKYQLEPTPSIYSFDRCSGFENPNFLETTKISFVDLPLNENSIISSTNLDRPYEKSGSLAHSNYEIDSFTNLDKLRSYSDLKSAGVSLSESQSSMYTDDQRKNLGKKGRKNKRAIVFGAAMIPVILIIIIIVVVVLVLKNKPVSPPRQNIIFTSTTKALTSLTSTIPTRPSESPTVSITTSITPITATLILPTTTKNLCNLLPCQNDGTCAITNDNAQCKCLPEFTGTFCENKIQVPILTGCQTNPCFNKGTCIDLGESNFKCFCSSQFTGSFCKDVVEIKAPSCTETPCLNGGNCLVIDQFYSVCLCKSGFEGLSCETTTVD